MITVQTEITFCKGLTVITINIKTPQINHLSQNINQRDDFVVSYKNRQTKVNLEHNLSETTTILLHYTTL